MPWTQRESRHGAARMRHDMRRWRYDHSETLRSVWIGATVVVATLIALAALKLLG
ncbi:MAG: hypothetical protein JWQ97_816 [Phenylobacterium sp.]|nr:hypothetical protein [Phenylobacterium sp.]